MRRWMRTMGVDAAGGASSSWFTLMHSTLSAPGVAARVGHRLLDSSDGRGDVSRGPPRRGVGCLYLCAAAGTVLSCRET